MQRKPMWQAEVSTVSMVVHPEAVDHDVVDRSFFRVKVIRSHQERAARDPDHVLEGRSRCGYIAMGVSRGMGHASSYWADESQHNAAHYSLKGSCSMASVSRIATLCSY